MTRHLYLCYHEAAHAVVGTYVGLRVLSVAVGPGIVPLQGSKVRTAGQCVYEAPPRTQRYPLGVMLAAGSASDRMRRVAQSFDEVDLALASGAGFGKRDIRHLLDTAGSLLRGPCSVAWHAVAQELRERDLVGADVRRIFRRSS